MEHLEFCNAKRAMTTEEFTMCKGWPQGLDNMITTGKPLIWGTTSVGGVNAEKQRASINIRCNPGDASDNSAGGGRQQRRSLYTPKPCNACGREDSTTIAWRTAIQGTGCNQCTAMKNDGVKSRTAGLDASRIGEARPWLFSTRWHLSNVWTSHPSFSFSLSIHHFLLLLLLLLSVIPRGVLSQASAPLEYYLSEESPSDTVVGNLVQDLSLDTQYTPDELDRMQFSVSDTTGEPNLEYFVVDTIGGIIKTARSIDREEICFNSVECEVNLKILVSPAQYFQVIKVIVHITDRNDHTPTFPQGTFSKSIPETTSPGAAFLLPIAEDPDSGIFGVQRYRLYGDRNKFALRVTNSTDGIIESVRLLLVQGLDRETQDSYTMRVVASDGGSPPKSGTMSVIITLIDANDHSPKFDNDTYEVVIPENTPSHTTIVQVRATDPDVGRNGEIRYSFAEDTLNKYADLFEINSHTGEIYLSRIVDYEEGEIYYLSAVARDQAENPAAAFARVIVRVRDVNDHAPKITLNFLKESQEVAQVLENSEVGTFVAHVSVSDPDGGRMGEISCSMQSPYFELEQLGTAVNEYTISTRVVFDREVRGNYEVMVTCRDRGQPPMEAVEAVPIFIIDENDHQPQFWKTLYTARLLENNDRQAFIKRVNATDGDSDGNAAIKYELAHNADKKLIHVDPISGLITAKVAFDYEKQKEYSFRLIAYDQGEPSRTATATLSLSIIDVNDEPPQFTKSSYVFSVSENQPGGEPVGQVTATDKDSYPFNDVTYSISPAVPLQTQALFKIDALTGTIRTKAELDREKQAEYHLRVVASNEGYQDMTSTVNVTITVGDQNDNDPILEFPNSYNNTIQVPVQLPKGRVIAQVKARDPDLGSNGQLSFYLANENKTFKVDPRHGYITVEGKLTELEHKLCKMWVIVKDNGNPPRTTREEVSIVLMAGMGKSSSQKSSLVYLSPTELIIICAVGSLVVLIIVVVIIIFTVKRCDRQKQKQQKYTAGTHDNSVEADDSSTASKCSDCCSPGHVGGLGGGGGGLGGGSGGMILSDLGPQKPSLNGQCGKSAAGGDRPKKEVKFLMDNGGGLHTAESSTDDPDPGNHAPWPTHIGSDMIQNPKAHSTALGGASDSSEAQEDDKLGPLWHDQPGAGMGWGPGTGRGPGAPAAAAALPVPPPPPPPATCITRSSPIAPLTEMELEMHEMLQMFGRDKDSETGSFTDSGRGPSEEGDTRPSPLDPKLNEEHKGAMLRSGEHGAGGGAGGQRGLGNHYRPSDSAVGRRLNALPKSSSFGTAPPGGVGAKNLCTAHPTIHGVKPPMYNTSYIPVPSADRMHRVQHQHSADSTGSGSDGGGPWSDPNKLSNHKPATGSMGQMPARTGILKFAHTNRRPMEAMNGSRTLPPKSGSLDSGMQGGPEACRQHIPVPNTFQGPYHGNIDKQRSQPSSVAGSRASSSQSLNINAQQPGYQVQTPNRSNNSHYTNHSRTLSPSHRGGVYSTSPHQGAGVCPSSSQPSGSSPMNDLDSNSKSRSPKQDRLPGATSKIHPSQGLYNNPGRYGVKAGNPDSWGNESVLSDDARSTCASTTSGSYMVDPDADKEPSQQQTMV